MTSIRRLIRRRSWPEPPVTEPEVGVLYDPGELGLPFARCKGVSIGGCVDGGHPFPESAHAHVITEYRGIICVREWWLLWANDPLWAPRDLMWHEYAHLLAGPDDWDSGSLHLPDSRWAELMRRWGLRPSRVS